MAQKCTIYLIGRCLNYFGGIANLSALYNIYEYITLHIAGNIIKVYL